MLFYGGDEAIRRGSGTSHIGPLEFSFRLNKVSDHSSAQKCSVLLIRTVIQNKGVEIRRLNRHLPGSKICCPCIVVLLAWTQSTQIHSITRTNLIHLDQFVIYLVRSD